MILLSISIVIGSVIIASAIADLAKTLKVKE